MANKTPFTAESYDNNVRKVIPLYDILYDQIFDLMKTYIGGNRQVVLLDTGCGSGNLGERAVRELDISRLVLCDPSEDMLAVAKGKLGERCEYRQIGSEKLDYAEQFDIVTAIQSHNYFDKSTRELAVGNCFRALRKGGLFICFENTAPFTETGKEIMLDRVAAFGTKAGRTPEEVAAHRARYGTEFFPLNISEHLDLLRETGFSCAELFWHSYMQSGFYAIK